MLEPALIDFCRDQGAEVEDGSTSFLAHTLSLFGKNVQANLGPERRKQIRIDKQRNLGPERRKEIHKKNEATLGPEGRHVRSKTSNETKRSALNNEGVSKMFAQGLQEGSTQLAKKGEAPCLSLSKDDMPEAEAIRKSIVIKDKWLPPVDEGRRAVKAELLQELRRVYGSAVPASIARPLGKNLPEFFDGWLNNRKGTPVTLSDISRPSTLRTNADPTHPQIAVDKVEVFAHHVQAHDCTMNAQEQEPSR